MIAPNRHPRQKVHFCFSTYDGFVDDWCREESLGGGVVGGAREETVAGVCFEVLFPLL